MLNQPLAEETSGIGPLAARFLRRGGTKLALGGKRTSSAVLLPLAEMLLEDCFAGILRRNAVNGQLTVVVHCRAAGVDGLEDGADGVADLLRPVRHFRMAKPVGGGIAVVC